LNARATLGAGPTTSKPASIRVCSI
jgi:hypothetical protein